MVFTTAHIFFSTYSFMHCKLLLYLLYSIYSDSDPPCVTNQVVCYSQIYKMKRVYLCLLLSHFLTFSSNWKEIVNLSAPVRRKIFCGGIEPYGRNNDDSLTFGLLIFWNDRIIPSKMSEERERNQTENQFFGFPKLWDSWKWERKGERRWSDVTSFHSSNGLQMSPQNLFSTYRFWMYSLVGCYGRSWKLCAGE